MERAVQWAVVTGANATGIGGHLRRLAGQSAVYGLGSIASRVVSFLMLPLYTRYLRDPAEYGHAELILTYVVVLGIVAKLGLTSSFFRFWFDAEDDARRRRVFRTCFTTIGLASLAFALAIVALAGPLADVVLGAGTDNGAALLRIAALGIWVTANYELVTALFRVQQRPLAFSIATVINIATTIGLTVLFVVGLGMKAEGLLLGNFLGSVVVYGGLLVVQRRWLGVAVDRPLLGELLRFGLPLIPAAAAVWAVNMIDRPAVQALAPGSAHARAELLGVYAVSYKLVQGITLLINAFQLTWPAFAYSIRDDDEARRTYAAILGLYVAVMGWAVLGVGLLAPWLLRVVATARYAGATEAVVPLAAGTALYGTYYIAAIGAGRAKRTGRNWLVALAAAAVDLACLAVLVPRYGIRGAGWSAFVAYLVMVVLMLAWSQRVWPVPYPWGRILRAAAAAGGLLALGLLLSPDGGAGGLAARLALAAVYPAVLIGLRVVPARELRRLGALVAIRRVRPTA